MSKVVNVFPKNKEENSEQDVIIISNINNLENPLQIFKGMSEHRILFMY